MRPHEDDFARRFELLGELAFMTIVYATLSVANGTYSDQVIFSLDPNGFISFKNIELNGYVLISALLLTLTIQTLASV
jgi:hypothetical protein